MSDHIEAMQRVVDAATLDELSYGTRGLVERMWAAAVEAFTADEPCGGTNKVLADTGLRYIDCPRTHVTIIKDDGTRLFADPTKSLLVLPEWMPSGWRIE